MKIEVRSSEEIEKKLKELLNAKTEIELYNEFGIRNIDEFNMAIKVLKWVLESDGK
ncbi:MAG: hypothetical protein QXI09_00520 [Candidatus Aenigmatarchaeota archaeon]